MLAKKPKTFDEFLQLTQGAGYEIKSGKHIAFKGAAQKKFIRLRSLGEGYSEDEIKAIIEDKAPQREVKKTSAKQPKRQEKSVNLLVQKKKAYGQYHIAKKEMQNILTAKANIDRLLGLEQEQKQKEKSQEQR